MQATVQQQTKSVSLPWYGARTVLAPKLADMVRAKNFFKRNRRKPILQATVPYLKRQLDIEGTDLMFLSTSKPSQTPLLEQT